jgi:hypothetical protein
MPGINEWDVNFALHPLFKHSQDFMLVFQDSELHRYLDRHLRIVTALRSPSKRPVDRRAALTSRGTHVCVYPQEFRPDGVLLDRSGRPYLLETKLGPLRPTSKCVALIVQTLVYADLLLTPRWKKGKPNQNAKAATTTDLLADLHEAHWFSKGDEGVYRSLEICHRRYFGLSKSLQPADFNQVPGVIFLLEDQDCTRLKQLCGQIKAMDFSAFIQYAETALPKNAAHRRHLGSLRANWATLRQLTFAVMKLDLSKFTTAIDHTREDLA